MHAQKFTIATRHCQFVNIINDKFNKFRISFYDPKGIYK